MPTGNLRYGGGDEPQRLKPRHLVTLSARLKPCPDNSSVENFEAEFFYYWVG
jgi:hypothetical protein